MPAARRAQLWLEVRESNAAARAIYVRLGFDEQSACGAATTRRPHGRREDAIVMSLPLEAADALD